MPKSTPFLVLLLLGAIGAIAAAATASNPLEGRISLTKQAVGWNGGDFGGGDIGLAKAETFELQAALPRRHWQTHEGGVETVLRWDDARDDFDLRVVGAGGRVLATSATKGGTSERVMIPRPRGAVKVLVVARKVVDGADYRGGVTLQSRAIVDDRGGAPAEPLLDVPCTDGKAGPFPCSNVDLQAFLPIEAIGGSRDAALPETGTTGDLLNPADRLNDIWGWTDPQTGREYALVGKSDGVAFVDITDAKNPTYLGDLPTHNQIETIYKIWRDLKVYRDHVYVVSEEDHGMQVFDLTRLRGATEPQTWTADAHYDEISYSHNIAINEESGFAYIVGSGTCDGGPHMVDIREPKDPRFAGCVEQDGYTHDTQCVNYDGPDQRFRGREICFNSNEDTLTIVDVTEKSRPKQLSRTEYEGSQYTHQGWLTDDGRRFLLDDELDEQTDGVNTTTRIFDVERLDRPTFAGSFVSESTAIDHNLYTVGDTVFEANYRSGLRVLDAKRATSGQLSQLGFFDVYPNDDEAEFNGAWSVFPYYRSGNVVVSGIEQGLFVLRPTQTAK